MNFLVNSRGSQKTAISILELIEDSRASQRSPSCPGHGPSQKPRPPIFFEKGPKQGDWGLPFRGSRVPGKNLPRTHHNNHGCQALLEAVGERTGLKRFDSGCRAALSAHPPFRRPTAVPYLTYPAARFQRPSVFSTEAASAIRGCVIRALQHIVQAHDSGRLL